jgi:hypothetical protein
MKQPVFVKAVSDFDEPAGPVVREDGITDCMPYLLMIVSRKL